MHWNGPLRGVPLGLFAAVHESEYGPQQNPRPATAAAGYRGTAGTTLTFDCNSRYINQKHA
jgi:hypothetical protein